MPETIENRITNNIEIRKRVGNPNFFRGCPGGPGRPKGLKIERTLIQDALKLVQSDPKTICNCQIILGKFDPSIPRCGTVREHYVRRSLVNDQIISPTWRKLDPDLTCETGNRDPTMIQIIYASNLPVQQIAPLPVNRVAELLPPS